MAGLSIENALRPCLVGPGKTKCLFHGFWQQSDVYAPSLLKGGHNGGVVSCPVALVETEEGNIVLVNPIDIKFVDRKMGEYSFGDERVRTASNSCEAMCMED